MKANTLEVKYREDKSDEYSARRFIEFKKLKWCDIYGKNHVSNFLCMFVQKR